MPKMDGVGFSNRREIFPDAKRALLTAYADSNAAISAINEVGLNYFFLKPWDPPEERLYPQLDDMLDDWQASYRPVFQGIRLLGRAGLPALTSCAISLRAITFPISGSTLSSLPTIRRPKAYWRPSGRRPPSFPSCCSRMAPSFWRDACRRCAKGGAANPRANQLL